MRPHAEISCWNAIRLIFVYDSAACERTAVLPCRAFGPTLANEHWTFNTFPSTTYNILYRTLWAVAAMAKSISTERAVFISLKENSIVTHCGKTRDSTVHFAEMYVCDSSVTDSCITIRRFVRLSPVGAREFYVWLIASGACGVHCMRSTWKWVENWKSSRESQSVPCMCQKGWY